MELNKLIDQASVVEAFYKDSEYESVLSLSRKVDATVMSSKELYGHGGIINKLDSAGSLKEDGDLTFHILRTPYRDNNLMMYYETLSDGKIFRVGPCEYYYPNGNYAGIEIYDMNPSPLNSAGEIIDRSLYDIHGNRVEVLNKNIPWSGELYDRHGLLVSPDTMKSSSAVYFDLSGKQISRSEFDVIYRKELEKVGLKFDEVYEFAPRIKYYNNLVQDLLIEFTVGGDRFNAYDIRELLLAFQSDIYLDMLADDLRNKCDVLSKESDGMVGTPEFFENQIRTFVYGELGYDKEKCILEKNRALFVDDHILSTHTSDVIILDSLDCKQIRDIRMLNVDNEVIEGCHELTYTSDGYPVMERFYIPQQNYREVGISVTYYPDGKISDYSDEMSVFAERRFFDKQGRITNSQISSKDLRRCWSDYTLKVQHQISQDLRQRDSKETQVAKKCK